MPMTKKSTMEKVHECINYNQYANDCVTLVLEIGTKRDEPFFEEMQNMMTFTTSKLSYLTVWRNKSTLPKTIQTVSFFRYIHKLCREID